MNVWLLQLEKKNTGNRIIFAKKFPRKMNLRLSLPADVLWGSFVTHSFLPRGRLPEALQTINIP